MPECLGEPIGLTTEESDLLSGVWLNASRRTFSTDASFRSVHEEGGFLTVPGRLEVLVCPDDGVDDASARDYCRRAEEEFEKRGAEARFREIELDQLDNRLRELERGEPPRRRDVPVLFMLADSGRRPSDRLSSAMRVLDQHRLPWRRAYAADDRTWSVADQAGSVLQAAGGTPHGVVLEGGKPLPWSIGIDLSHRESFSRVAAALINPDGKLVGAWTIDQPLQEHIAPSVVPRLLVAAVNHMPVRDRSSGVLVVRDGRVFEREDVDDYRHRLDVPVTLVELRKRGNPPLLLGDRLQLPTRPVAGWLPDVTDGLLAFIVTLPQSAKGEFDSVLKIWMRREWDGMRLGRERLIRILFAQTLTPGLGLHRRRLPAPIYWADGIAGASDDDLRFRGQDVVELD